MNQVEEHETHEYCTIARTYKQKQYHKVNIKKNMKKKHCMCREINTTPSH